MIEGKIVASSAYIKVSITAGASPDTMQTITRNQVADLKSLIARMTIELPDATASIKAINESPFNSDQRSELLAAMHAKTHTD